ncbi:MAG: hypothetical protein ACI4XL_00190 [Bacillus sp. (in: firmicutes)]
MEEKTDTIREVNDLLEGALRRDLNLLEQKVLNGIMNSSEEERVAFIEMMKEMLNKKSINPIL